MKLSEVIQSIPDYGKDVRLNLENIFSGQHTPGISSGQLWASALAIAYALKNFMLQETVGEMAGGQLGQEQVNAAKACATIMAMNNIYYRSIHFLEDSEIGSLPAKLRMTVIGKPGVPKVDFELMSLAVSAIEGCGLCVKSHAQELKQQGISAEGIQSVLRLAAVLNSAHQALAIAR